MSNGKIPASSAADSLRIASELRKSVLSNSPASPDELEVSWSGFMARLTGGPLTFEEQSLIDDIKRVEAQADDNRSKEALALAYARKAEAEAQIQTEKTNQGKIALANAVIAEGQGKPKATKSYGRDPSKWRGQDKLAILRYLVRNSSAKLQKVIEKECSSVHGMKPNTVRKAIGDLRNAGWLTESAQGMCLSGRGLDKAQRVLRNFDKGRS